MIVDAFDAPAVEAALRRSKAEAVTDDLTSLPKEQSNMPRYPAVSAAVEWILLKAAEFCASRETLTQLHNTVWQVRRDHTRDNDGPGRRHRSAFKRG